MAYNSDGYIMLDFTEVDFRRTNQTIEGLFKRCVDVIGTNKFILVINANGRTPLPATCSFTNNQYVIDTVIYMFAVSSNDNLFIRRNDVPASDIIDDSSISVDKTWSSTKIDSELDTKGFKSFIYTGKGNAINIITFPEIPTIIYISKLTGRNAITTPILFNHTINFSILIPSATPATTGTNIYSATVSYNDNELIINGGTSSVISLDTQGEQYIVYYI